MIITQQTSLLDQMDEWNQNQHGSSGLIDAVKKSSITEQMAEIETLDFVSKYVGPNQSPMCGNTVSHDRRFLAKYMPRLESYFNSLLLLPCIWMSIFKQHKRVSDFVLWLEIKTMNVMTSLDIN